jgi:IstB-like ATP binding protein/Mu transposase, C-terminal domain
MRKLFVAWVVPRIVVLDNLREGVIVADIYDPTLNPLFRDVLAHYGVVAMPCRIKDPDRKGKVEAGVGHAQKTPLKGLRFESLEEAQVYLDRWEERWADTRIHGTTKRQVAAMFAEEKASLLALPLEPFRYYQYGERVVHLDGCVEVEAAYYGLPPGWIGRSVKAQWDALHVRILHPGTNQLLREHLRQKRGWYRIKAEDYPKRMMRKLAPTAAEELLEIVMRRHERASTLLTSNRPVEDWGKLLGDSAAVTAMLDRLLHHGHILKCGPRSWRTKTDLPDQEKMG